MDRFILKHKKFDDDYSSLRNVYNIYGATGSGKTTWIKNNVQNYIEIDDDILKSKESTLEFIDRLKTQSKHIVIDNFDVSAPGSSFFMKAPVTKVGCTFLVSTKPISGVPHTIHIEGKDRRNVLFDKPDVFNDPIDVIKTHLSTPRMNRIQLIDELFCEHGNLMGFVHENYTSAKCDYATVMQNLSDASLIDYKMYDGGWGLMPFFINSACAFPCSIINGSATKFNQASFWTKHMNACMHKKQFRESRLDLDTVDFMSRTGTPLKFYNIDNKNGKRRRRTTTKRAS